MIDTDPFASAWEASGPAGSSRYRTERTTGGALATVVLAVGPIIAISVPTATFVGLVVAAVLGTSFGFVVGARRRSNRPDRLCIPGTGRCVRL